MRDPRFAKFVLFINSAVPLTLLGWDALHNTLGANPVEFALRTTGMLTLIFLLLTLTVTPIRKLTGWNWLSHFRRMLGLFAFFYGTIHMATYDALYANFDIPTIITDVTRRRFIIAGVLAWLLLLPLALTSTNWAIRKLGGKNWNRLHKLVYLAIICGVIHYWWQVKPGVLAPMSITIIVAVLLLARPVLALWQKRRTAAVKQA